MTGPEHYAEAERLLEHAGSMLETDVHPADHAELVARQGVVVAMANAHAVRDEFLGRVCITGSEDNVLLNQRIARLTPIGMNPRFVFWVLKSPVFRRFVDQLNTGSLIQHMFTWQLAEFVFPIPPMAEQERIVAAIDQIMSRMDATEAMLSAAQERGSALRTCLLGAAFSGHLLGQDTNYHAAAAVLAPNDPKSTTSVSNGQILRSQDARRTRVTA